MAVAIVRDHALAEDVVQEAAIVALNKLEQYQPGTSFRAWMSTMVRYVSLNHARKARKHRAAVIEDQQPAAPPPHEATVGLRVSHSGAVGVDPEQFDGRVVAALDGVGDTARACLLLRTVEGMKYAEIAELLGVPEGTAMSHVHRTRQLLRKELADLEPRTGSTRMGA